MYSAAIDALASTGQLQEAEHMLQQLLDNQAHVFAALTASMGSSSRSSISATAGQQLGQSRADGGTQDSAGTASAQDQQAVHSFLSTTAQLN
jgi:pentatricopeptide repeat protein